MSPFLKTIWNRLARLPNAWRWILKLIIAVVLLFFIIFPRPVLFIRQISRYTHPEELVDPDFPGIQEINQTLDSLLEQNPEQTELQLIQSYIYTNIEYIHDWDQWHNSDYWASPAETWRTRREDCDGQAILAVSIMRSRGYSQAQLGINLLHIWARIDSIQIMGAMPEENIRKQDGQIKLRLPSVKLILQTSAYLLEHFPAFRSLLILFIVLGLAYHPQTKRQPFLGVTIICLLGFILLRDWAIDTNMRSVFHLNLNFYSGVVLIGSSILFTLFSAKINSLIKRNSSK